MYSYFALVDNVPSGLGYAMKELKDNTGLPRPGVDDEHFGDVHRDYEVIALAVKKFIARVNSTELEAFVILMP